MTKEEKNLLDKFKKIAEKRWIKGINNYTNGAGLTFESLLGKKEDSLFFPDYYGIEIKCTQRYSRYPISLFSSAFDGPSFFEMNEILNRYGKVDYQFPNKKTLYVTLSANEDFLLNNTYYFKLKISKTEERIYLEVKDINHNIIEKTSYINLNTIKDRIEAKLSTLALVYASKKNIENNNYFRYYKICIYRLKFFENFINALEKGIIKINLVGRISRSGSETGRQRNKNLVFQIDKKNIEEIFKIVKIYDHDKLDQIYFF